MDKCIKNPQNGMFLRIFLYPSFGLFLAERESDIDIFVLVEKRDETRKLRNAFAHRTDQVHELGDGKDQDHIFAFERDATRHRFDLTMLRIERKGDLMRGVVVGVGAFDGMFLVRCREASVLLQADCSVAGVDAYVFINTVHALGGVLVQYRGSEFRQQTFAFHLEGWLQISPRSDEAFFGESPVRKFVGSFGCGLTQTILPILGCSTFAKAKAGDKE